MPTLKCVTEPDKIRKFCYTDCGPSEGCSPDDECNPDDRPTPKKPKISVE